MQGMPVFCITHYQTYKKLKGGSLVKHVHLLLCTQGLTVFVEKLFKYEISTKNPASYL